MTIDAEPLGLLRKADFTVTSDWTAWKREWSRSSGHLALSGLLRGIFDVQASDAEATERLLFLLELADGHVGARNAIEDAYMRSRRGDGRPSGARTEPMEVTAFGVLRERFFASGSDRQITGAHVAAFTDPGVFAALLRFLHDHDRRSLPDERNLYRFPWGPSAHENVMRTFVLGLISCCWEPTVWNAKDEAEDARLNALFRKARPAFIRLLSDFGALDFLLKPRIEVDEASLEALRRIALDRVGVRVYATAAQAALECDAGRYLLLVESALAERSKPRSAA